MQTPDEIMTDLIAYAYEKMEKKHAYPFAACVVKNGVIISRGYNSKVISLGNPTYHGEMEAMTAANKTLLPDKLINLGSEYELYSTCEPCLACFDSALWAGIKTFVFSVDHTDFPDYFHDHPYTIEQFEVDNPGKLSVTRKLKHPEGIALFQKAKELYGW